MVDVPFSTAPEAEPLDGGELVLVSQLSPSITISAATISAQASDNSFNDSGDGFVAAGFAIDDYVYVEGFTGDVANNIFSAKVTAVAAGKLTIAGADGDVIVDDAAGETVVITKWVSRRATTQDVADLAGGVGSTTELDFEPPTLATHATNRQTAANFTASATDVAGKGLLLSLNPTGTGDKHIGQYKAPPSAPFTLTCRVRHTPHNATAEVGLMLHNTSNNRNLRCLCLATRQVFSQSWSNLETFNGTIGTGPTGSISNLHIWLRITVDGSGNVAFFWSNDGAYWKALGTTTLATYLTASGGSLDEVGVYARANGNGGLSGATFHYYDES